MKTLALSTAAILTIAGTGLAEGQECGTVVTERDREVMLRQAAAGAYELRAGPRAIVYVPLTFHVVRTSGGTGGLPAPRICQALDDLDAAFLGAEIQFYLAGPIDYIDDDAFYFDIDTGAEIDALRSTNPVPDTINVYFTENLASAGEGLCGRSSYTSSPVQGIVMKNSCTALPTNHSTFPHEVGHYFDLFHTHENWIADTNGDPECVDGSNCGPPPVPAGVPYAGDWLCDTPADPNLDGKVDPSCTYTGTATDPPPCSGDPYAPDPTNLMSYSRKECRDSFSAGQNARALATLTSLRPELDLSGLPGPADCNTNGIRDGCDIATGTSGDSNTNGVPDECETFGPAFPAAPGFDTFASAGVFQFRLTSPAGGGVMTVRLRDTDSIVLRSAPHLDAGPGASDTSGDLGDGTSGSLTDPRPGTSDDDDIVFHPPGYEVGGVEEIHTEMTSMWLEAGDWGVRAGDAAPEQTQRSYGEVETRSPSGTGFPADSFFNLYVAIDVPDSIPIVGLRTLCNHAPLVVESKGITAFPPSGAVYLHNMEVTGKVALFDCFDDCFVGWLEQATHGLGPAHLQRPPVEFPVLFSLDEPGSPAEGLIVPPDPACGGVLGHPEPNDVFALGMAGGHGYETQGELFESSGLLRPSPPDATNVDRISAALGIGPAPFGGPPYLGPFSPNSGEPDPSPIAPGGPTGVLGLEPGDNVNALSFGMDGGDVLIFSVGTNAIGLPVTAVRHQAVLSLPGAPSSPAPPYSEGGAPGEEASGDLFISPQFALFGGGTNLVGLTPAPSGSNHLQYDEWDLGLQAPATFGSAFTPPGPEDNLDALEADTADTVDADTNGIPDIGAFVFFSLDPLSPTVILPTPDPFPGLSTPADLDGVTPDDILVAPPPEATVPPFVFAIYARGVEDIGLLPGDDLDALVLFDAPPLGVLDGGDEALFSLAAGSPSLAASANPSMPGGPTGGPYSPGDVFHTAFAGPGLAATIGMYATAAGLGLAVDSNSNGPDELDALDIGHTFPCDCADCGPDYDGDGIHDLCDNCPDIPNEDQLDPDGDGVGSACQSFGDADRDGLVGPSDVTVLMNCLGGPDVGGIMLPECTNFDFDFDFDVDLRDYALFQMRFGGCAIPAGPCNDCNGNGVADTCDVSSGTSTDCNADGIPDECWPDCNANGIPDDCDIAVGTSGDCGGNGVPDECEPDCNANGIPDDCDIAAGTSGDCGGNGVPDECEPDCNADGIPDDCDIAAGSSADCNNNNVPDECDLAGGTSEDCNSNGVPDECELVVESVFFAEDFDAYANGSQMHGQGGWKGWDNDPAFGAQVTDAQVLGQPHSVDINGNSDLVHEFTGATFGRWRFTTWQYIPSSFSGEPYLVLLNTYSDGGPKHWSSVVHFNTNGVVISDFDGAILPLITDQWVELQVDIDLNNDTQTFFYGGSVLYTKSWTEGIDVGGALNVGGLDLFANGSSSVYYDDISLVRLASDCNSNGLPDDCDIAAGSSADLDSNGIPDECESAGHNCCDTGHGAGCSDPDIELCVCGLNSFCCTTDWDAICVQIVELGGCGTCRGACCQMTGCAVITEEECNACGCAFLGVGTTCAPDPCGEPSGGR